MTAMGLISNLDHRGRVGLPEEIRKRLDLKISDSLEVLVDNDYVLLKKIEKDCIFCGSNDEITEYYDKVICQQCLDEVVELGKELV